MSLLDRIASSLKDAGFPIKEVQKGSRISDGGVWINNNICVVVATDGTYVSVTYRTGPDAFEDLDDRKPADIDGIIADVRSVLSCAE